MQFDVIVVGASTAGLHAARKLAEAGKKVAVFDRQKELKPARRTLIVTPELCRVLPDLPEDMILHRTGTIRLSSPSVTREVQLDDPDLIVDRAAITRWLLFKSRDVGVDFFPGHRFVGFEGRGARRAPAVAVHFHNHGPCTAIATEAVIGADGINSSVARAAGIPRPPSVSIVQAEVDLPPGWDPDVTQVWFEVRDTRFFYWLVPESPEAGVVGLIGDHGCQTGELLKSFLGRLDVRVKSFQAARVAMHHPRLKPWRRLHGLPLYMVGDAAGQVKVTTVGGLVTGLAGARAAVRAVVEGSSYHAELRGLKRELNAHCLIRWALDRFDDHGYWLLIRTLSTKLSRFLGRYDRDSVARHFWRILLLEPRLLLLGLTVLAGSQESVESARLLKPAEGTRQVTD